ncbi:MAG: crossover junction endodeoxyribonuclease RuvC [Candidatus Poribacteria bacterium]|nr:crossover junction endodeoxyribonuclease RuvC [Candidatus Poribacteria bacterium]
MSKFLDELNPSQREAVKHTIGPLLIIAGPGSGKTRTVAHSIAYAIEVLEVGPKRIAAFTFGRKAKDELKDRVSEILIGNELANDIWISTFHSFCGSVIKRVLDYFRTNEGRIRAKIDHTQHHIFPEDTKEYVIDPHYMDTLKDTLKKSEQLADDDNPYTKVQLSTRALFRDVPEVKAEWQEEFDLIFVDEYQDTDQVQHEIIRDLVERHQNLRVVGDDDQGIYGWRGADIQNILNFEKNYPNAKVISLGQNYRSTLQIVNASRAIIDFNPDRREKKLFTNNREGDKVKHLHCEDREAEASTIADFICRAIQNGWTADDFVVLCSSTDNQAAPFIEAFKDSGILSHVVENSSDTPTNCVSIMTIHKSKGLEFPNVFVAGVCSGLFPHYNSKEEDWDEQLRLLYVAMTRSENWLCLSSYEKDFFDKNTSFERGPSRFLDFIPQSLVERVKTLDNIAIPSRVNKVKDKGENAEKSPEDATSSPIRHQTVLGIDPGKENVGWSITKRLSDRYTCKYGNERPAGQPIDRKINELIMEYSPDAISVEKLEGATDEWFLHVGGCVAQIRSIADQWDIEYHFYSPQDVKYAVTGNKNALKEEVQQAVKQVCNLEEIPEPHHSADAIATSLCYLRSYLNYSRFQNNARMKEHYDSGTAYLGIRRYNEAIVEFEKAINNAPMIDPMYTKAHCGLARAYIGQNKLVESENSVNEALRLNSKYQPAQELLNAIKREYYNQGIAYIEDNEYGKAINLLLKASNIDPNDKKAYTSLGRAYYWQDDYTNAASYYQKAVDLDPNDKTAHSNLGNAYYYIGAYADAIHSLQKASTVDSNCEKTLYYLARTYFRQGKWKQAKCTIQKALSIVPTYQLARKLLDDMEWASDHGMIRVSAGDLQIESNNNDAEISKNPIRIAYVDEFYIDIYPVTNAQYKKFVDENPEWQKERISNKYYHCNYLQQWNRNNYPHGKGDHPVTYVSWYAAMAYAQWVGKRLPTELEWEKAARGGLIGQEYPWGNLISSNKANYGCQFEGTTPVGHYAANGYGLYDMVGNVWEWCLDEYNTYKNLSHQNYTARANNTKRTVSNITNVKTSRVLRGGSWYVDAERLRIAYRFRMPPTNLNYGSGFRCVRGAIT